ncbi:MAG TPA: aromatic ring-hydroxylating dioxygenase subunit alpha [Acetobacteraceae bacterium]|nr:aromatic ring-hydroxylating dioxygenase subunit alpha [Acetobacteraceae bacterium]
MLIRNAWYVAAWADEIGHAPLARRICNQPVVLFRDSGGQPAALQDMCCHRGAPLHFGKVVDQGLECGYHGLTFDRTGRCVRIPGQDRIPDRARVPSYPVVERDAFLWIWMGDPAKADEAQIVSYPWHNDARNWPHRHTTYHIKAAVTLMVDNLMDLTHLGYVHTSSIGGNPAIHVEAKMQTERTPRGLKFTRWMLNSVPPPTYVRAVGFQGRIDRAQMFEFIAPCAIVQLSAADEAGAYRDGDVTGSKLQFRLFHGLTPETDTTCFYFWSTANGFRPNDPAATEQLFQEIGAAFQEDLTVVEGQQARLSELGEGSLVDIANDATRLHMRRTIERMLAEDASALAAE